MDPADADSMMLAVRQRVRRNLFKPAEYRGLNLLIKPIAVDLDRAAQKAGHDPKSRAGRLYRLSVGWRVLTLGTLTNILCAMATPSAAPLLAVYPLFWIAQLINYRRERLTLDRYG